MNENKNRESKSEGTLGSNFDTILVAVDFSEVTARVYDVAASLAERLRAKVAVLNVSEPQLDYVGLLPTASDGYRYAGLEQQVAQQLGEAREFLEERGLVVETEHHWGPVVASILDGAQRRGAGLIVLGSHGHGAFYNLLVGSVAEGVLRDARIPVVVVPSEASEPQGVARNAVETPEIFPASKATG